MKAGGGVVYFPAGTYKFTKNIELASNVVIRGASTNDTALVRDCAPIIECALMTDGNRLALALENLPPRQVTFMTFHCFDLVLIWRSLRVPRYAAHGHFLK